MDAVIPKFLDDQYTSEQRERDHEYTIEEEERFQSRKDALWSHPWFFGAVAALFIPGEAHWKTVFLISMIAMGVCFLLFWFGKSFYSVSSSVETAPRGKFGVTQKENGHRYAEMLAMSFAFIAYSLVEATGSTFFFEQTTFLDDHVGKFTVPVVYLTVLQSFSKFIIPHLWGLLIPKQRRSVALVKIGCGLVLSVLCCVIAWRIEIRRSSKIKVEVDLEDNKPIISMSILWLLPQFSLLGLMRGLAEDGLVEFFAEQVVDDDKQVVLRYYGPHVFSFVLGIGTLLTAVSILGFRRTWLDDDIYKNRLDKYYRGLVFLGVANLGYYLCIALYFYKKQGSQISAEETNDEETASKGEI
ncbi:putative proton-dependent oligopeptide transporter family, major facilitator superfamily [Rosa chinensis]|uniref:Putative proton-dependent oligopeptide transporter family, major facilitator superfamily n=1 Tax=Rosa chinensis TaxID=74649 RepID=A0A2P6QU10_ROSCH|nr:putative proton-dependent oligopeptide transporter family, major facilitator superfamily [Rosa chinensis]